MALQRISTPTMASLAAHWLGAARPLFDRPLFAGVLPHLEAIAADLEALSKPSLAAQVDALRVQARALDAEHDDALGPCWTFLTAVAGLYPADAAAAILELRDRTMPGGLSMKMRKYQDQGAAAAAAKAALTAADRARLTALSPADVDLNAWMDRWIEAGLALRVVDAERATRAAGPANDVRPDELAVRRAWMRLVAHLRSASELDDLSSAERGLLLAKLEEEDARATRPAPGRAEPPVEAPDATS